MNSFNRKIVLPGSGKIVGTGWIPSRPDLRDYTVNTNEIRNLRSKMQIKGLKLP